MTVTRRGRIIRNIAQTLAIAAVVAGIVLGIVFGVRARLHHDHTETRDAIAGCTDNGGTFIDTGNGYSAIVKVGHRLPRGVLYGLTRHTDPSFIDVEPVAHTSGGVCLTPVNREAVNG